MNSSTSNRPFDDDICPDCGNPVPIDSPLGMCPTCLLGSLSSVEDTSDSEDVVSHETIAGYQITGVLGEGGFSIVYEATQRKPIKRSVALKVLREDIVSPQILARFEAEQQALAMMDHPNIAAIFDAGETENGIPYVAMERVVGIPITEFIENHELPRTRKLMILRNICEAVQHAHLKGIIHRDIKPSNILVTEVDGNPVPNVIDFGIARALDVSLTDRTLFTEMHQLVGTPNYMSPEQASLDNPSIDGRSDIYSLGVLIYEIISGVHPIVPDTGNPTPVLETLRRVREVEPARLSSHDASLKGDLEWVVHKTMAKAPEDRYDSAGALARELTRIIDHLPVEAGPPSRLYQASKFIRRHRTLVTSATIAAAALITGAIVSTVQYFRASALASEVQANEVELRQTFRNADYQMALQLSERRRTAESIAYFCRALRTDPGHRASASCLLTILTHQQLSTENDPPITYPESISNCRLPLTMGSKADNFAIGIQEADGSEVLVHFKFSEGTTDLHPLPFDGGIRFFAPATVDGRMVLADESRMEIRESSDPAVAIYSFDFTTPLTRFATFPEASVIVAGDHDGGIHAFRATTGETIAEIDTGDSPITALTVGRDGNLVGYGTASGEIGVWGLLHGLHSQSSSAHTSEVTAVTIPASGTLLASGDNLGNVHLHRPPRLQHIAGPLYHSSEITTLNIAPGSRRLISGADDGYARIWDLKTHRLAVPARYDQESIYFVNPSYQPENMITAGTDGTVRIVDILTGNGEALPRAGRSSSITVSNGRDSILSLSNSMRSARLLDLSRSNAQPRFLDLEKAPGLSKPDAPNAVTSTNGEMEIKLISAKQLKVFRNGRGTGAIRATQEIRHYALRNDARMLAVLHENQMQLWNPATLEALSPIIHLPHPADALRFPTIDGLIEIYSPDYGWMQLSIPPAIQTDIGEWFLAFAERLGGRSLDETGILHTTHDRDLRRAIEHLPEDLEQLDTVPARYVRWLTADPSVRELGPGLDINTADYVSKLINSGQRDLVLEALRISPDNPGAIQFLRTNLNTPRRIPPAR